ncbi:single-stranded DNA-binding protein 3-like isoform X2 [Gordionus sp. m RMFG-2023]|uniref:single-stranded DNA-binding protein 3-like isoform X2 n=1 Tax=Gordionus sp. m RMFG-2023 TaxID=3053472 RepID=UPI0031FC9BC6
MMYSKGKGNNVPSDAQAREKLALYVYEYLLHVGAQKAAQTFLSEIRWEKNITLGEPPGFLHSWWCVFWDLYCAAPERRESCEHSSEAKAFHDYGFVNSGYPINGITHNPNTPSPLGPIAHNDLGPSGPMPPAFFPNSSLRPSPPHHSSSQPSPLNPQGPPMGPNQIMSQNQNYMSPRYAGGRGLPLRMPSNEFNHPPNSVVGHPLMNNIDPRQMQPRMSPPNNMTRVPLGSRTPLGHMTPPNYCSPMRMERMPPHGSGPRWQNNNNTSSINNYSASNSPMGFHGSGGNLMPSPQDGNPPDMNFPPSMMKSMPMGNPPLQYLNGPGPGMHNMNPNGGGNNGNAMIHHHNQHPQSHHNMHQQPQHNPNNPPHQMHLAMMESHPPLHLNMPSNLNIPPMPINNNGNNASHHLSNDLNSIGNPNNNNPNMIMDQHPNMMGSQQLPSMANMHSGNNRGPMGNIGNMKSSPGMIHSSANMIGNIQQLSNLSNNGSNNSNNQDNNPSLTSPANLGSANNGGGGPNLMHNINVPSNSSQQGCGPGSSSSANDWMSPPNNSNNNPNLNSNNNLMVNNNANNGNNGNKPQSICSSQSGSSQQNVFGIKDDQNESAAILKIKESMQEEAKLFEKGPLSQQDHQQNDYFMQ